MAYYPNIPNYKPFYVQRPEDTAAVNIMTEFGVVVKSHAIPYQVKPKELYKNSWHDAHGDDEYVGDEMYMEAFTLSLECVMITKAYTDDASRGQLYEQLHSFQQYLSSGKFFIYDTYLNKGFCDVRLSEFPEPSSDDFDSFRGKTRLIFNVVLKVNDPVTEMWLNEDQIEYVEETTALNL